MQLLGNRVIFKKIQQVKKSVIELPNDDSDYYYGAVLDKGDKVLGIIEKIYIRKGFCTPIEWDNEQAFLCDYDDIIGVE